MLIALTSVSLLGIRLSVTLYLLWKPLCCSGETARVHVISDVESSLGGQQHRVRTVFSFFHEILPLEFMNFSNWSLWWYSIIFHHPLFSGDQAVSEKKPVVNDDMDDVYSMALSQRPHNFRKSCNTFTSALHRSFELTLYTLNYLVISIIVASIAYDNEINSEVQDTSTPSNSSTSLFRCEDVSTRPLCESSMHSSRLFRICDWNVDEGHCVYSAEHIISSPTFLAINLIILFAVGTVLSIVTTELLNAATIFVYDLIAQSELKRIEYRSGDDVAKMQRIKSSWNPFLRVFLDAHDEFFDQRDDLIAMQSRQSNYMKAAFVHILHERYDTASTEEEEISTILATFSAHYLTFRQAANVGAAASRIDKAMIRYKQSQPRLRASSLRHSFDNSFSEKHSKSSKFIADRRHQERYSSRARSSSSDRFSNMNSKKKISVKSKSVGRARAASSVAFQGLEALSIEELVHAAQTYGMHSHLKALARRLRLAKEKEQTLADAVNGLPTAHEQDKFLVIQYIISEMGGSFEQQLCHHVVFNDQMKLEYYMALPPILRLGAFAALVAYVIVALVLIFVYAVPLDDECALVWLLIVSLWIIGDLGIVKSLRIYVESVLLPGNARIQFLALHNVLFAKCKQLLSRREKIMSINLRELAHIFNPTLRLARRIMILPAARLLVAINKGDHLLVEALRSRMRSEQLLTSSMYGLLNALSRRKLRTLSTSTSLKWFCRNLANDVSVCTARTIISIVDFVAGLCLRLAALSMAVPSSLRVALLECVIFFPLLALSWATATVIFGLLRGDTIPVVSWVGFGVMASVLIFGSVQCMPCARVPSRKYECLMGMSTNEDPSSFESIKPSPDGASNSTNLYGLSRTESTAGERLAGGDNLAIPIAMRSAPTEEQPQAVPQAAEMHHHPDDRPERADGMLSKDSSRRSNSDSFCVAEPDGAATSNPTPMTSDTPTVVGGKAKAVLLQKRQNARQQKLPNDRAANDSEECSDLHLFEDSDALPLSNNGSAQAPQSQTPASLAGGSVSQRNSPTPRISMKFFTRFDSSSLFQSGAWSVKSRSGRNGDIVEGVDYGADPFHSRMAPRRHRSAEGKRSRSIGYAQSLRSSFSSDHPTSIEQS